MIIKITRRKRNSAKKETTTTTTVAAVTKTITKLYYSRVLKLTLYVNL